MHYLPILLRKGVDPRKDRGGLDPKFSDCGDEYLIIPHFLICLTKFCFFIMQKRN